MTRPRPRPALAGVLLLAACAVALVVPGAALASSVPERAARSLTAADRDLLVRVRLAGLWEQPAALAARGRAQSPRVREIAERIAAEHHDLDQVVLDTAARLGVDLPDVPNEAQQGWLDELASSQGGEFDRVFVERLRAAHGVVFPLIAAVRAGTRNDIVRAFAATAAEYVARHLGYLDSTGLVNYVLLPPPTTGPTTSDDGRTLTADGLELPADRDLLTRVRQASLWQSLAAQEAARRGTNAVVRAIGAVVVSEQSDVDTAVHAVAEQLGLPLPDHPDADQRDWLAAMQAAQGEDFDRAFVERVRAADGDLLVLAAQVRAGTRHELVRAFATATSDAVLRQMSLVESSGLVDYDGLPWPAAPPGARTSAFDQGKGPLVVGLWVMLGVAALAGAVTLRRLVRTRWHALGRSRA